MFKEKITLKNFISDYFIDDVSVCLATYGTSDFYFFNFVVITDLILSSEIEPMYLEWKVSKFYIFAGGLVYLLIVP